MSSPNAPPDAGSDLAPADLATGEFLDRAFFQSLVDDGSLHETIERLCRLADFDDTVGDLYAVAQKRTLLEAEHTPGTLEESGEYRALVEEHERLQDESPRDGPAARAVVRSDDDRYGLAQPL
jgi:hypothetical protein